MALTTCDVNCFSVVVIPAVFFSIDVDTIEESVVPDTVALPVEVGPTKLLLLKVFALIVGTVDVVVDKILDVADKLLVVFELICILLVVVPVLAEESNDVKE